MVIVFSVCAFSVFECWKERKSKMLIHVTSRSMQCYSGQKNLKVFESGMELIIYDWWKLFLKPLKNWFCDYLNWCSFSPLHSMWFWLHVSIIFYLQYFLLFWKIRALDVSFNCFESEVLHNLIKKKNIWFIELKYNCVKNLT